MVKKRMYYNYPCYVTATDTALSSKKKVLKRVVCCESLLDAIEAVSVFRGKKVYSDIMVINHYPFYEAMSSVNVCV